MPTSLKSFRRTPSNDKHELTALIVFAVAGLLLTAMMAAAQPVAMLPF